MARLEEIKKRMEQKWAPCRGCGSSSCPEKLKKFLDYQEKDIPWLIERLEKSKTLLYDKLSVFDKETWAFLRDLEGE